MIEIIFVLVFFTVAAYILTTILSYVLGILGVVFAVVAVITIGAFILFCICTFASAVITGFNKGLNDTNKKHHKTPSRIDNNRIHRPTPVIQIAIIDKKTAVVKTIENRDDYNRYD